MNDNTPQTESPPALRQHHALRAHLTLDDLKAGSASVLQLVDLGCYLQVAWHGACRQFKSPPKRLAPAQKVVIGLLESVERNETPALSESEWEQVRDGVVCADGVWERLSASNLMAGMKAMRDDLA